MFEKQDRNLTEIRAAFFLTGFKAEATQLK